VPGPTPHYPPEFKREVVKLYPSSGKSIPKMAEELMARGMHLGLMPGMSYVEKETILQAGQAVLL